jgi:signal peptidase I
MRRIFGEIGGLFGETVRIVVISLLIILPIRYFVVQPFFVRGESMSPNFEDKDYLIINELSYRFSEPQRGEVIIFRFPQDQRQYYIKRIVGLPEETIEIAGGQVMIYNKEHPEGFVLEEKYLNYLDKTTPGEIKIKLDPNEYFVLGDNRDASSDSRRWGTLPRHFIIGKAWLRVWPFDKAQAFAAPAY